MPLYGNVTGLGPKPTFVLNNVNSEVAITVVKPVVEVAITVVCD